MPSKRTSTSGSKATSSPAKKQRGGASVVAPVDPLLDAYAPMLQVLRDAGTATESGGSAADLLCAALPSALRVAEGTEQRHAYQEKMLDVISAQLSSFVTSRNEVVLALEKDAAGLEANEAQSRILQREIAERLAEKNKMMDDATQAGQKQQSVLEEAEANLEAARKAVEAAEAEKQALETNRDDFTAGLTSLWAPLKNSEISGKQWREREKKLGRLAEKMKLAEASPSLLAALPVALKLKAEARSEFAQATLACAEELYMKHIEVMKARVDDFGAEVSTRIAAVVEAESAQKAAQEALDAALETDIAAQNAWLEVTSEQSDHDNEMNAYGPGAARLQEQLAKARAEVAHLQEVFDSFEALQPAAAILTKVSGREPVTVTRQDSVAGAVVPEVGVAAAAVGETAAAETVEAGVAAVTVAVADVPMQSES